MVERMDAFGGGIVRHRGDPDGTGRGALAYAALVLRTGLRERPRTVWTEPQNRYSPVRIRSSPPLPLDVNNARLCRRASRLDPARRQDRARVDAGHEG
jgi:hypothetical protein